MQDPSIHQDKKNFFSLMPMPINKRKENKDSQLGTQLQSLEQTTLSKHRISNCDYV